jgi:hypothetical protein
VTKEVIEVVKEGLVGAMTLRQDVGIAMRMRLAAVVRITVWFLTLPERGGNRHDVKTIEHMSGGGDRGARTRGVGAAVAKETVTAAEIMLIIAIAIETMERTGLAGE